MSGKLHLNLKGKKFGKLRVLKRVRDLKGKNGYWLCRCRRDIKNF